MPGITVEQVDPAEQLDGILAEDDDEQEDATAA
eukprot:COSAG05_NODE_24082_length_254_cov_0.548387_1_plen_32_part_10